MREYAEVAPCTGGSTDVNQLRWCHRFPLWGDGGVMANGTSACHFDITMSPAELSVIACLCIMLMTSGIGRGKRYYPSHVRKPTLAR